MTDENKTPLAQEAEEQEPDALERFLGREQEPVDKTTGGRLKNRMWLIIAAAVVVVLVGVLLTVGQLSPAEDDSSAAKPAEINLSIDDEGEHQAEVVVEEKSGEPQQNGSGTLLSYAVADIARIDVENESGSFTVLSETPTAVNEDGEEQSEATVYTLVGYEEFALQDGMADAVANDASVVGFSSIIDTSGELSDYGLDSPRARVEVTYTDGTTCVIRIGSDAAADAGAYIAFGSSDTVYLAAKDSVDSFLYGVLDLISLEITEAAADTDSSELIRAEISGEHYRDRIVMEKNTDTALRSGYLVTAPRYMAADSVESADIAGAVRGLYAEQVACVNPSQSQLEGYGLDKPYAKITAEYADTTVRLSASAPGDDGTVYLLNPEKKVIYVIGLGAVEWANTSLNKLSPETMLDINLEAVSAISMEVDGKRYDITVNTTTESVENDEGEVEDVTTTTAYAGDKRLDDESFAVFFQNLNAIKLTDGESGGGSVWCTVTLRYTTGRSDDVVQIYRADGSRLPAALNGESMDSVYKSTINKLVDCVDDLINGRKVTSF